MRCAVHDDRDPSGTCSCSDIVRTLCTTCAEQAVAYRALLEVLHDERNQSERLIARLELDVLRLKTRLA